MRERKVKKRLQTRRVFLVICEGETERTYVELLKRHYRLPITIKTKVSGDTINERLLKQYLNELDLRAGDNYEVFFMYDADVQCVADKLCKLPGKAILTNPCIELWYILHIKEHRRALSSNETARALAKAHPAWEAYAKGTLNTEQQNMLMKNMARATQRAATLALPGNPSTEMPAFIGRLEEAKRRETDRKSPSEC